MATENIKKRALAEQNELEEGIKVSLEELEDDRFALVYNGKQFDFPKQQPAWVSMFVQLYGEGPNKELSDQKSLEFIVKLAGKELAEEIVEQADNNFSIADVAEQIVQPIKAHWAGPKEDTKKK